ncbi:MAG: protein-export membrane protein SecF, partial [Candidatus Levybacteria bacterium RIFCSPLOWO2_01_FULL_40_96]
MNIIDKKNIYFLISLILIIPGLISLMLFGVNLSIEFTGGSRITVSFPITPADSDIADIKRILKDEQVKVAGVEKAGKLVFVRTAPLDQKEYNQFIQDLSGRYKGVKEESFETVGPTIGKEITQNAIKAILLAAVLVVIYISTVFRRVPKPASSIRFGVATILAMGHDVLVVLGAFSIFGHFFGVEVDSLFITAMLTIIGFSVHDTIVVFDRIRENLSKSSDPFEKVVNDSILQTLNRSLNTSLTVILVLFAMLLFGGESIRWFVVAL